MNLKIIAVCLLIGINASGMSQTEQSVNMTDKEGRKQGRWIKKYPNGNIMYDGFFKDDMPSGMFKRYYEDKTIKSELDFIKDGTEAKATLYYSNGFIASAGRFINQLKEGKWQFFSSTTKGLLISEEEYTKDKRNGISIKYYPDSTVAEKIYYRENVKHGEYLKYYLDGSLILRSSYKNGKLDGKFEAFYENGKPELIGQYKEDLREGLWIVYKKDGTQRFKTIYTAGMPDNREIDFYQSDFIDSLEKNKVKIPDPEKTGKTW